MSMNLDDPNLTAYALGELTEAERKAIETAMADSPETQAFVRQTQETAQLLRTEFQNDLRDAARKPLNIMPLPMPRSFWSDARWLSIGVAALLAIAAIIGAVILSTRVEPDSRPDKLAKLSRGNADSDVQMEVEEVPETSQENVGVADASGENPFLPTATNPVSRLSFHVGRESYESVRRSISNGTKPPRESVRLEQLINYFSYDYSAPLPDDSFSINLAAAGCPWQSEHRIVRVAVKAREMTAGDQGRTEIARGAQLMVNFSPASVTSYRLLGFEDQTSAGPRGGDTVGAGQTLTVLYEVVPAGTESQVPLVSVSLSYYSPAADRKFVMQDSAVEDHGADFERAPADLKFAAAVAEFGMILRDSPHKGNGTLAAVLDWSNESKGRDTAGDRAGFIELVRKAQTLAL
ncbi:MAG: YfbK domain-containing protein [Chthoniobacterales bacterium]